MLRGLALAYHPTSLWKFSGSERRFAYISRELRRLSLVEFDCIESSPTFSEEHDVNYTCHPISLRGGIYSNIIEWVCKGFQTGSKIFSQRKPDFIYATNNNIYNVLLGSLLSKFYGCPLVVVVHHFRWSIGGTVSAFPSLESLRAFRASGLTTIDSLVRWVGGFLEAILLRFANGYIAISNQISDVLLQFKSGISVRVAGNGIDFEKIRLSEGVESRYDSIYVGRIDEGKGIVDLVKLWKLIKKQKNDAVLAVIGTGTLFSKTKSLSQSLNLDDNICFFGYVPDEELFSLLKSSRVFITLSTTEGWGLAVGEALAAGLPIVAYELPSFKQNFGNCKSVFLRPIGDIEGIAKRVLALISQNKDLTKELEAESIKCSEKFDWKDVAVEEYSAIEQIIMGARAHRPQFCTA